MFTQRKTTKKSYNALAAALNMLMSAFFATKYRKRRLSGEHCTDAVESEGKGAHIDSLQIEFLAIPSSVSLREFHRQLFKMQTHPVGRKAAL